MRELAGLWRAHRDVIAFAADRAERLGRAVAAGRPDRVLCRADLHLANLLVDDQDRLAVVDWDGLELAPRERDLGRFMTETPGGEQARFFEGWWSTTGSATRPGGTPSGSSGGCSRPGTWSRWPGGSTAT